MAEQIGLSFFNGQSVEASQMNEIVRKYNGLVNEFNGLSAQYSVLTKSQEMVRAYKSSAQNLTGLSGGTANTISGWAAELNRNSMLNASTGILTFPETAAYKIEFRVFVSINNATRIRSKLSIVAQSQEMAKNEINSYGTASTISNYRQDMMTFAQSTFNGGTTASANVRIWDATSGQIPVENPYDTFMVVTRIY